ncbi:hypothetical protein ACMXYV_07355 [Neptuniibacter sp. SY11_33]|uniref:hypothetical protein n=1 Tax=Neptuniibacter sp. SY11_33 TaxID=3398215 RepID=UPI0039F4EE14
MNKKDFFDEDYEYEPDEGGSPFRKTFRHRKHDEDWDQAQEENKRNKRKTRWRDIEERLAKKSLRENSDWSYGNYDF